ncbi:hypothetical protein AKG34_10255 [Peribacillus butanolivorans]|uniref:TOPRIM nucleotidyl transferase/hydrolase domain-containing protein n=1 Tax=Peribacillus butanolivorans TaxID=421767 RepID=UPI0006A6F80F|nr:TOPRIM nucleotidyl transferase/hydrolase domain-containing protein [Peribacillus butanolivorans]KON69127.1 hypothetical protein AKG34_10255 [Peribacillus butanolivorans]
MDIQFFVGVNGAGKSFNLNKIYSESENSLYVNEEGLPSFSIRKPRVKIDLENKMYHFIKDSQRGTGEYEEPSSEHIQEKFLILLYEALELQKKNEVFKNNKSKGQEKFSNLLTIFTDYNFNNLEYICLDEPENFLDEDYIKLIGRLILNLAKVGFKVRVATHSVRILTECRASIEQIIILNRAEKYNIDVRAIEELMRNVSDEVLKFENKHMQVDSRMKTKLKSYEYPRLFKSLISQTIENEDFYKCLFNKTIILVEGESEVVALKAIKNRFESSTEFFTPHGKVYMPFFAKLFSVLGKEVVVIIDVDTEKQTMPWVLTQYFENERHINDLKLISHQPDFEEYYNIPWREIAEDIGLKNKILTGELKPLVAMIFFDEIQNQQVLYDNLQRVTEKDTSIFQFV